MNVQIGSRSRAEIHRDDPRSSVEIACHDGLESSDLDCSLMASALSLAPSSADSMWEHSRVALIRSSSARP